MRPGIIRLQLEVKYNLYSIPCGTRQYQLRDRGIFLFARQPRFARRAATCRGVGPRREVFRRRRARAPDTHPRRKRLRGGVGGESPSRTEGSLFCARRLRANRRRRPSTESFFAESAYLFCGEWNLAPQEVAFCESRRIAPHREVRTAPSMGADTISRESRPTVKREVGRRSRSSHLRKRGNIASPRGERRKPGPGDP